MRKKTLVIKQNELVKEDHPIRLEPSKIISPSARTQNQKVYIKKMQDLDMVICSGPAGTGKTHLAVGMAVYYLRKNYVEKIIIARPAVEAGEKIGYMPGGISEKMDPFMRPIFDELGFYLRQSEINQFISDKKIEIVPIGFTRGRTFNNSFIIYDESQNLEFDQMKMVLTRFGIDSKIVFTGDIDQSDLPSSRRGAFRFICDLFKDMEEIGVVTLGKEDIQRHELVGKIVEKWEKNVDKFKKDSTIG